MKNKGLCRRCNKVEGAGKFQVDGFGFCSKCNKPYFLVFVDKVVPVEEVVPVENKDEFSPTDNQWIKGDESSYGIFRIKSTGEPYKKSLMDGDTPAEAWRKFKLVEKYKDDGRHYKCLPVQDLKTIL